MEPPEGTGVVIVERELGKKRAKSRPGPRDYVIIIYTIGLDSILAQA